jgi:putative ABC transport system substrate-binding protein
MTPYLEAFPEALGALGWVDGRTITLDWRFTADNPDLISRQAENLVALPVDVLVVGGSITAIPAMHATTTIPIVFVGVSDPVGSGLVASLAHPASNLTGISLLATQASAKYLELLKGVVPGLTHLVVLADPANPSTPLTLDATQVAADALGVGVQRINVRGAEDLPSAFELASTWGADALLMLPANIFEQLGGQIAAMALQAHLPTAFNAREPVENRGLLGYGPNLTEIQRRAAVYVDKVLKGAKPADLPVEQPTAFEIVINRTTAQALGLTIPPDVAAQITEWVS